MKIDKKEQARELYLSAARSQAEIADILNVDRKTVFRWMKTGLWEEQRKALRQTPSMQLQNIYNHLDEIEKSILKRDEDDRLPSMEEIEKMRKLHAMARPIREISTGTYMDAFNHLCVYLEKWAPDIEPRMSGLMQRFVDTTLFNKEFRVRQTGKDILENYNKLTKYESDLEEAFSSSLADEIIKSRKPPVKKNAKNQGTSAVPNTAPIPADEEVNPADSAPTAPPPPTQPVGQNGAFSLPTQSPETTPVSNITDSQTINYENEAPETAKTKCPISSFQPMGHFPQNPSEYPTPETQINDTTNDTDGTPPSPLEGAGERSTNDVPLIKDSTYYASLPPDQRPSPFREGNVLWVNHIDDTELELNTLGEVWGERKMGDSVRRYPDMDEYEIQNRKIYEMRMKVEEEFRIKDEKARAEKKAKDDAIITEDEFEEHYWMLQHPSDDIFETVTVKGVQRNRMALQYNLRELLKPEAERNILSDDEYRRAKAVESTLISMRRDYGRAS